MEGVPRSIHYHDLRRDLKNIDGVCNVHSLHIWSLTLDRNAIAVHLAIGKLVIHFDLSAIYEIAACSDRCCYGYRKGAANCYTDPANQIWDRSLHGPSRAL